MSGKTKWNAYEAMQVAAYLSTSLGLSCERVEIAGSLRRRKEKVGDIELLIIPRIDQRRNAESIFEESIDHNCADERLRAMLESGELAKRVGAKGGTSWGAENKLGVHVESGIPVDIFTASAMTWANLLVCRTGGMANNIAIASNARARGWKWNPYNVGFTRLTGPSRGTVKPMYTEREIFAFAGMKYQEPWERA